MTTETETFKYRVTLDRPSRSKCPNAWAKVDGEDGWLPISFEVSHGTQLVLGGTVRRATRQEKVLERPVIDRAGSWAAWGGAGRLTIEQI